MSRRARVVGTVVVVGIAAWLALAVAGVAPAPRVGGGATDGTSADSASLPAAPPGLRGWGGMEAGQTAAAPAAVEGSLPAAKPEGGGIRGRVVGGANGRPMPKASVRARLVLDKTSLETLLTEGGALETRDAVADGEGRFLFAGLPAGRWALSAHDPLGGGRSRARDPVTSAAGETADAGDLVLKEGAAIRGRVLAVDGTPRRGVDVWAVEFEEGDTPVPVARPLLGADGPREWTAHAVSGPNGAFALEGVPAGEAALLARARDDGQAWLAPVRVDSHRPRSGVDLRLMPTRRLTGTVRFADGTPAAEALVLAFGAPGGEARLVVPVSTVADRVGAFALSIPSGGECASLAVDASRRLAVSAVVPADADSVDLTLRPTGRIVGRVVAAADGRSISGARARAFRNSEEGWDDLLELTALVSARVMPTAPGAVAGGDGRIEMTGAPSGRASVHLTAPGFVAREVTVEVPVGGTADLGDVALTRGRVIEGTVVDAAGAPLSGVEVKVERDVESGTFGKEEFGPVPAGQDPPPSFSDRLPPFVPPPEERVNVPPLVTDGSGRFSTPPLPPGSYEVRTSEEWTVRTRDTVDLLTAEGAELRVVLRLAPVIRVTVLDAEGRPAAGVRVYVIDPWRQAVARTTDADGRTGGLATAAGRWTVALDLRRAGEGRAVTTDGRSLVDVTLRLPPLATVRGRLLVGGKPLAAGATVKLAGTGATNAEAEAKTDATGAFAFPWLAIGTYRLTLPKYPDKEGVHPVEVPVPDATDREVEFSLPEPPPDAEGKQPPLGGGGKCGYGKCG